MSNYFKDIKELPPDPLFGLKARYTADSRRDKVDLGIGAYRDSNGKPWILPAVKEAEKKLTSSETYNHEYLPIAGYEPFLKESGKLILGVDSVAFKENRVVTQQTLSGTGSLHVAGLFLKNSFTSYNGETPTLYLSNPTWANHKLIFSSIGFKVAEYPYWNNNTKSLDMEGFLSAIKTAPKNSIFLLHPCAHNPTGLDPNQEQWRVLLDALAEKEHVAFFDSAYQGFASGNLERDAFAVRYAIDSKIFRTPIVISQSFAKNCGMYGERVGALHIVPAEKNEALNKAIKSQISKLVRSEFSNPPAYGAKVVATVLSDPQLRKQWQEDLVTMSSRIIKMRAKLRDALTNDLKTPGNWDHIVNQIGMFSYTGLQSDMVKKLESEHGVYLVSSGRVSVAGLNEHNVEKVAHAIHKVVTQATGYKSKL